MIVKASDYAWFDEEGWELEEAYCLTLIDQLTPESVIHRMDGLAARQGTLTFEEVLDAAPTVIDEGGAFVAITMLDGWALMVEPHGFQGVRKEVAIPLSRGSTVVSHYRSVNADNEFVFARDGRVLLFFDPMSPGHREGAEPDLLVDVMAEIGFRMSDEDRPSAWDHSPSAAAFALAEYITGIRVSRELITNAQYFCARVESS